MKKVSVEHIEKDFVLCENIKNGEKVVSRADKGLYTEMDLGIAQYHFDAASGKENFGLKA